MFVFLSHSTIACNRLVTDICLFSQTHYVLLLCSFKDQLQQHVRVHAMEAVMACWELEQNLQSLTGIVQASFLYILKLFYLFQRNKPYCFFAWSCYDLLIF
jgi:hypothetical protein